MSQRTHPPAVHRATPSPPRRTARRLWFGILAGPAAWTIHELVGTALVGRRCAQEGRLEMWHLVTLIAVSILAAALAAAGAWAAFRVFRGRSAQRITQAEGWDRVEFMAIAGVIISLALLANILLMGVVPAIIAPCMVTT